MKIQAESLVPLGFKNRGMTEKQNFSFFSSASLTRAETRSLENMAQHSNS